MTEAARDRLAAAGIGLVALALYVRTLAPGLIGIVDTPMFQFVGRVVGVGHNPGYPLFVLLTWPVSYLPFATLAYRINLFSAVMGAVAVALAYGIARRLGCRRVIAASAALALACGRAFWSQAVIAEVYTLNAALQAGSMLFLLTWRASGRPRHLYGSVALFSIGLANHLTILGLLPGMLLFVALHDGAWLRRPAVWLRAAGLAAAGLAPYLLILIRSHQAGAYVESPARSLGELARVISGSQFADGLFAYDWAAIATERVPFVLERLILPELTYAGLGLACAGVLLLWTEQRGAAWLLLSPALAVAAFITNYDVIDAPVFMIPAWVAAWPAAGFAIEQAARRMRSTRYATAIGTMALLLPVSLAIRNYDANDRSDDVAEQIYFDRLFEALPDGAVVVREDYLLDRMVMYMLLGEGEAERGIGVADAAPDDVAPPLADGAAVYAFPGAAASLRLDGLDVDFAPLRLIQGTLSEFLERLPPNTTVGVAAPAIHAAALAAAAVPDALRLRNGSGGLTLVGPPDQALEAQTPGTLPHGFNLYADAFEAAVQFNGRDLLRVTDGAVLATWTAAGEIGDLAVLRASERFAVPFAPGPLSVRRVRDALPAVAVAAGECRHASAAWATGIALVRVPPGGTVTVGVEDAADAGPRVVAGPSEIVSFGAVPAVAEVCLSGAPTRGHAEVIPIDTGDLLRTIDATRSVLAMHRDDQALLIGTGWSEVDVDAGGPFRRMTGARAELLVPIERAGDVARLELQLHRDPGGPAALTLLVNGTPVGTRTLQAGWHRATWPVPAGLLVEGANTVVLDVDTGDDRPGPAVATLAVARER